MYTYLSQEYITSQFAVRFDKNDNLDEYQKLEKTAMVVDAKNNTYFANPFNNSIDVEEAMHESVVKFIND